MRKYLLGCFLALVAVQAWGAVAFQKSLGFSGTIPTTSSSYTPNIAADQFICPMLAQASGGSANITASASVSTFARTQIASANNVYDAAGTPNAYALWGTQSLNGGAETYTISTPSGITAITLCVETSGGVSVKATSSVATTGVSSGGTISGTAGTVASTDILFWMVYDYSSPFDTVATCGAGSTTVGNDGDYLVCYQAGTGSSMTPTATAVYAGPSNYYMVQWVESSTGGGSSCTNSGYTSAGALAVPNGSSGSYVGKTGSLVTPDCSSVNYWQPALGNFGVN